MAKIEIPDSMVPEGYELGGIIEHFWSRETGRFDVTVALCRKPRLKQIVFTVAGEPRKIVGGEWFIDFTGEPRQANHSDSDAYYVPLTRTEEFE